MSVTVEHDLFGSGKSFVVVDPDENGGGFRYPCDGPLSAALERDDLIHALERVRLMSRSLGHPDDYSDTDAVRVARRLHPVPRDIREVAEELAAGRSGDADPA